MADKSRPIFKPKPSIYQRFKNRINWQIQLGIYITVVYFISHIKLFIDGVNNNDTYEKKQRWIKRTARDPDVGSFTKIDEEDPPKPIEIDPNLARFREEFAKLRQKVDNDYRHE